MLGNLRSLAKVLRYKKNLKASEIVSRYCVLLTMQSQGWDEKDTIRYRDMVEALEELAETLFCLERWEEAVVRFEEVYRSGAMGRGVDDEREVMFRGRLRKCYEMQGLYLRDEEFERRLALVRENDTITDFVKDNKVRKWGRLDHDDDDDDDEMDEIEYPPKKRACLS